MEPITAESVGDLATLILSFERSLRAANKSSKTFATHGEGASQLLAFIREAGMPTAVTEIGRDYVESFIERLVETKAAATADNRGERLLWPHRRGAVRDQRFRPGQAPKWQCSGRLSARHLGPHRPDIEATTLRP